MAIFRHISKTNLGIPDIELHSTLLIPIISIKCFGRKTTEVVSWNK